MIKRFFISLVLLCGFVLLFGQDSTGVEPGTGGSVFPASWDNVFDLIDLLVVWVLGIAASGSGLRRIFSILADVLPFLRTFVNSLEERAIIDLEAKRTARLKKAGKESDLQVLRKAAPLVLILMLCSFSAAAQVPAWAVQPDTFPGFYPSEERPGLEIEFVDEEYNFERLYDGDTIEFNFVYPDLLSIKDRDSTHVLPNFNRFPMWVSPSGTVPYMQIRQYSSGASIEHWYNPDSAMSVVAGGRFRAPIEGLYYAFLLNAPDEGRFIRFYMKTSERKAVIDTILHTITVIDSITVPVFDTVRNVITVIDSISIPVQVPVYKVEDVGSALNPIAQKLETVGGRIEVAVFNTKVTRDSVAAGNGLIRGIGTGLQVLSDSSFSYYQKLAAGGTGSPTPGATLEEVLLLELLNNTVAQLKSKYFKSKTIEVSGHQISTCTFASWAGVGCSLSEATIFTVAKETAEGS